MAEYQGFLKVHPADRFAIVVSRFNLRVTERLLAGARDTLNRHQVKPDAIDVFWVPGAFEIAGVVSQLMHRPYAAIVTIGAVVRGDTPHFDYVAGNAASAISRLAERCPMPVVFGVLTCNTMAEAEDRADGKAGNKGAEAALVALEMANLYRQLKDVDRTDHH
jgi:6,7-dimethyl-8-ribityllumazine synthase